MQPCKYCTDIKSREQISLDDVANIQRAVA